MDAGHGLEGRRRRERGVIVLDVNPGRDGLLGIALWLDALARCRRRSSRRAHSGHVCGKKREQELGSADVNVC